jgi:hypothetical protein
VLSSTAGCQLRSQHGIRKQTIIQQQNRTHIKKTRQRTQHKKNKDKAKNSNANNNNNFKESHYVYIFIVTLNVTKY